jgi:hypothetical protein
MGTLNTRVARRFYTAAAILLLIPTAIGFQQFYLHGRNAGGEAISPSMLSLVIVHGVSLTAWVLLFLTQALLIANGRRQIHRTLGFCAIALAVLIVGIGILVAVRSVQADPKSIFWGMEYRQFLLIMLSWIFCFGLFVTVGVLNRQRPARHRAMMLLATLSVLGGATVRIPMLYPLFGDTGSYGLFGPVLLLAGVLLIVRSMVAGTFDRWFAGGIAVMAAVFLAAASLASSAAWREMAHWAFNV